METHKTSPDTEPNSDFEPCSDWGMTREEVALRIASVKSVIASLETRSEAKSGSVSVSSTTESGSTAADENQFSETPLTKLRRISQRLTDQLNKG